MQSLLFGIVPPILDGCNHPGVCLVVDHAIILMANFTYNTRINHITFPESTDTELVEHPNILARHV